MQVVLDLVKSRPEANWVVYFTLGDDDGKGRYYDALDDKQLAYDLTMLTYDMNALPLLRSRRSASPTQRSPTWLQAGEMAGRDRLQGHLRRFQPWQSRAQAQPRVLLVSAVDLAGELVGGPAEC